MKQGEREMAGEEVGSRQGVKYGAGEGDEKWQGGNREQVGGKSENYPIHSDLSDLVIIVCVHLLKVEQELSNITNVQLC